MYTELQADELITSIKDFQIEKERFQTIADGRIKNIQEDLKRKNEIIDNSTQFMKDQLRAFFNTVKSKETKTQRSYSLLSGKLVMKKASRKIVHDEEELLEWAEQFATSYVEVKEVKKLKWAEFKKDLSIESGMLIRIDTGEIMEGTSGLYTEEVKESFDIK
jgi:hypothetical protein